MKQLLLTLRLLSANNSALALDETNYKDANWHFASAGKLAAFQADPENYAPPLYPYNRSSSGSAAHERQ